MQSFDDPFQRALRQMEDDPYRKMLRQMEDDPYRKMLRQMEDDPYRKMLRQMEDDPYRKMLRQMEDDPYRKMLRQMEDDPYRKMLRQMENDPFQKMLRQMENDPFQKMLRQMENDPYQRMLRQLESPTDFVRAQLWSRNISDLGAIAGAMPDWSAMAEAQQVQELATGFFKAAPLEHLGSYAQLPSHLEPTSLKLSALAGSSTLFGFEAASSLEAYGQLFGHWHTSPNLPPTFWRNSAMRRTRYREAEVDPGLVNATPSDAIEVAVSSGFVSGMLGDGEGIALLNVVGVSMQIRSVSPDVDAFKAITAFERALRAFIARKLESVAGPKWFKQRVPGVILTKARDNRTAALSNGERPKELIDYLDIGDLKTIVLRSDNWDKVFGYVFPRRDRLDADLQTLMSIRNPDMHAREVDGVGLVELMCVLHRLVQWIEEDGEWRRISESDD